MQDLLDTLLDISRLDAGLVIPKPADFPVADLLARLKLESGGLAEEKNLVLRVRPSGLWLHTDPHLLARVLLRSSFRDLLPNVLLAEDLSRSIGVVGLAEQAAVVH